MSRTRLITFALGAVLALDASYWFLRWPQGAGDQTESLQFAETSHTDGQALAQWLGQRTEVGATTAVNTNFRLLGVVAGAEVRGSAIIALEGKTPRSYRVGDAVADGLVLQSVSARQAILAPDAGGARPSMVLELQKPQPSSGLAGGASLPEPKVPPPAIRRSPRRPPPLD